MEDTILHEFDQVMEGLVKDEGEVVCVKDIVKGLIEDEAKVKGIEEKRDTDGHGTYPFVCAWEDINMCTFGSGGVRYPTSIGDSLGENGMVTGHCNFGIFGGVRDEGT